MFGLQETLQALHSLNMKIQEMLKMQSGDWMERAAVDQEYELKCQMGDPEEVVEVEGVVLDIPGRLQRHCCCILPLEIETYTFLPGLQHISSYIEKTPNSQSTCGGAMTAYRLDYENDISRASQLSYHYSTNICKNNLHINVRAMRQLSSHRQSAQQASTHLNSIFF